MTDREWWDALPADAEFTDPRGVRCRPQAPEPEDPPAPSPDHVFLETWAGGADWFPLAVVRTWERFR